MGVISPEDTAMAWKFRNDVTQEEIDRYAAVAADYIYSVKGWHPAEYRMRFIAVLADAPLAAFNVSLIEYLKELKTNTPQGFSSDPQFEIQVYVHTGEMRAFDDAEEYHLIRKQAREMETRSAPGIFGPEFGAKPGVF